MGAILNGLSLHGGIRPYGATFLVFSDYMRPAIRLAALMHQPVIYIFTHDSIGLGEDGPTHQPVEHLATLRAIPNLMVLRPADANETVEAWRTAIERRNGPTALIFSRQDLPTLKTRVDRQGKPGQGAYVLAEASGSTPQIILLGSGSEVTLCLAAREQLEAQNIPTRVVSMLSMELFEEQSKEYRDQILPYECQVRIAVETGVGQGWDRYVGLRGEIIGLEKFGASAPYKLLMQKFGFSVENVVFRATQLIAQSR
jgi:transketolase